MIIKRLAWINLRGKASKWENSITGSQGPKVRNGKSI